jgi:hypothetical protein
MRLLNIPGQKIPEDMMAAAKKQAQDIGMPLSELSEQANSKKLPNINAEWDQKLRSYGYSAYSWWKANINTWGNAKLPENIEARINKEAEWFGLPKVTKSSANTKPNTGVDQNGPSESSNAGDVGTSESDNEGGYGDVGSHGGTTDQDNE